MLDKETKILLSELYETEDIMNILSKTDEELLDLSVEEIIDKFEGSIARRIHLFIRD